MSCLTRARMLSQGEPQALSRSVKRAFGILICLHSLIRHTSVSSCLICRFILDLRSVYQQNTSNQRTDAISSINFAVQTAQGAVTASVVGNMGASLRTGEFDKPGADPEETRFSKDPFNFGLFPEVERGRQNDVQLWDIEIGAVRPSGNLHED